nr:hypothetical protein [Chitinophagaceae bacterium]
MKKQLLTLAALTLLASNVFAAPNVGQKPAGGLNKTASGCDNTAAVIDMDINNVRARLMTGGDMWWDRPSGAAAYEVPKNSNKNALFAGSIWIGGVDKASNELKVAGQTYRQSGNDYWTGPLDEDNGYSVSFQTCAEWDKFWKINASDVNKFRGLTTGITDPTQIRAIISANLGSIPQIIKEWPAKGNTEILGASGSIITPAPKREMAPYVDVDNEPGYNWRNGDYPAILGDQYIWWVFNDKGNAKTETQSDAIGLEIHTGAFAFSTNDCLNEATFYNFKIYNFSTSQLDSTYMATWCDADLGYAFDDFVGCDTARGLGILYNGDSYDEGATGYGFDIPMVGVDYFQGPKFFDVATQKDTELKMTVFTYFNNDNTPTGNPQTKDDFYGYITGTWRDNQPFTTACNARAAGPSTKFIFTGDPCKGGWNEASCNNTPADRRFVHSSGPFSLIPGAEPNNITIGAVWVPNVGGGKSACFSKIQVCDDKAQDLFDNAFKLPFGPQAPKVTVQPLDRKLIFDLDNELSSNNFAEGYGTNLSQSKYREVSKRAVKNGSNDSLYKFEGYIVYQLKDGLVAASDIRSKDGSINTDKARIAFQCDKKNKVKEILNYEIDPSISADQYIPKLMITGIDSGISHSFQLTQDLFATGTAKNLVNYKTYYYLAVAYGYNNFSNFNANKPDSSQLIQYLESRTDGKEQPIRIIAATPHPAGDNLYVQNYAEYGSGIKIKRIEGKGNSGVALDLTEDSEMEALQGPNYQSYEPVYKENNGPLLLKVVNPDSIKAGNYEVWFKVDSAYGNPTADSSKGALANYTSWFVTRVGSSDTIFSGNSITEYNEKYLRKYNQTGGTDINWGLAMSAVQQKRPGDNPTLDENGLITSNVLFEDVNNKWLSGVVDEEDKSFNNWIRAGSKFDADTDPLYNDCSMIDYDNFFSQDSNRALFYNLDQLNSFEKVIGGTFAPYYFASNINSELCGFGLQYGNGSDRKNNSIYSVSGVDIVMTPDKALWSRCPVIEMTESTGFTNPYSEGAAFKYNIRKHAGWNKDVDGNGNPIYSSNPADSGMSYFPGYAINVETGERLNVYFGESSFNTEDNGRDLIWNPTTRNITEGDKIKWGGKHVIYIAKTKYDGGAAFATAIRKNVGGANDPDLRAAYRSMMWVGIPLLRNGLKLASIKDGIIPTKTKIRIRVTRPYTQYIPDSSKVGQLRNGGWPLYSFSTNDIAPAKLGDEKNKYTNNKDEIFKRIHVVPNPYYAYSEYEGSRVDNRVKIINLPTKATIKIYTLDGALVKTISKNDQKTNFVDWDIKNDKGIPVASGMYIVHVNLPDIGETVLKWFGAMRPVDLISF